MLPSKSSPLDSYSTCPWRKNQRAALSSCRGKRQRLEAVAFGILAEARLDLRDVLPREEDGEFRFEDVAVGSRRGIEGRRRGEGKGQVPVVEVMGNADGEALELEEARGACARIPEGEAVQDVLDGIPEIAMVKSSDQVSMGYNVVMPSG